MKSIHLLKLGMAVLALFALGLFAVACGDDDDDSGDSSSGGDDATTTQGAGDDSDNDDDDKDDNSGRPGSDGDAEEYVSDLCTAYGEFQDTFLNILTDPENQDKSEEDALELFEEPFQNLLDALKDADPPGDIDEFHDALVENFEDALQKIKDGDLAAFEESADLELPEPSEEVTAKYEAIAEDNEDCVDAGFTFTDE